MEMRDAAHLYVDHNAHPIASGTEALDSISALVAGDPIPLPERHGIWSQCTI